MAFTLVDIVNKVLTRVQVIDSVDEELTDFTDNRIRIDVNMAIDAINDAIRHTYDFAELSPYGTATSSIALVDGTREYALNAAFYRMCPGERHPEGSLINTTTGNRLLHYPGGYAGMFEDQNIPGNYEGQPNFWVINPDNGKLRLDTTPGADEDGDSYDYFYVTQLNFEAYNDTFPMPDMPLRDLIPAMQQLYYLNGGAPREFNATVFNSSVAKAVASLNNQPVLSHYATP